MYLSQSESESLADPRGCCLVHQNNCYKTRKFKNTKIEGGDRQQSRHAAVCSAHNHNKKSSVCFNFLGVP